MLSTIHSFYIITIGDESLTVVYKGVVYSNILDKLCHSFHHVTNRVTIITQTALEETKCCRHQRNSLDDFELDIGNYLKGLDTFCESSFWP